MSANREIREKAKANNVRLWQIAEQVGINDGNFSRKMRKELPQQEKEKILKIIDDLRKAVE